MLTQVPSLCTPLLRPVEGVKWSCIVSFATVSGQEGAERRIPQRHTQRRNCGAVSHWIGKD